MKFSDLFLEFIIHELFSHKDSKISHRQKKLCHNLFWGSNYLSHLKLRLDTNHKKQELTVFFFTEKWKQRVFRGRCNCVSYKEFDPRVERTLLKTRQYVVLRKAPGWGIPSSLIFPRQREFIEILEQEEERTFRNILFQISNVLGKFKGLRPCVGRAFRSLFCRKLYGIRNFIMSMQKNFILIFQLNIMINFIIFRLNIFREFLKRL